MSSNERLAGDERDTGAVNLYRERGFTRDVQEEWSE